MRMVYALSLSELVRSRIRLGLVIIFECWPRVGYMLGRNKRFAQGTSGGQNFDITHFQGH